MSDNIHKSNNVSRLMYHFVFLAKYRRVVIDRKVDQVIKETCIEISKRYPIYFLEIGPDKDHVHFLIQSVPNYSPTQIDRTVKSTTAKQVISCRPSRGTNKFVGLFNVGGGTRKADTPLSRPSGCEAKGRCFIEYFGAGEAENSQISI